MLEKLLVKRVQENPEKIAIIYDQLKISYQTLYEQILKTGELLNSLGIAEGDCIAILLPNCPEFVISFYAIAKSHGIALPLNHLFKTEELSYYITDSKTKAIITNQKYADKIRPIISKINHNINLILVEEIGKFNSDESQVYVKQSSPFSGDVIYQYSSGSTGQPKRVCRSQSNLYHEIVNFAQTANINSEDRILTIVPLYHAHGLGNCMLASLGNGGTLIILEPVLQKGNPVEVPFIFRRQRVLEIIEQEKVSILPAVPYLFNTLAETPSETPIDLSSLRLCFSAGNFLSEEIFTKFLQRWQIPIRQLYGCTEAGSIAINLDEKSEETYNSVGKPMQNVDVFLIDDNGQKVSNGKIGEIVINSKALAKGYDKMPELNQKAFQNGTFLTGDLGKKDALGRLYITGRKKLLIDTGGYKVDPREIEAILMTYPDVKEAVIIGVKSQEAGEKIKAVIVPNGQCNAADIRLFCQQKLAEYKIPKIIEFRQEIPKSPLGKILRQALANSDL